MKLALLGRAFNCTDRERIRAVMRGYQMLNRTGRLRWVRSVKRELEQAWLARLDPADSNSFFGAGSPHARLSIQQYVLTRIGGSNLNKAILASIGSNHRPIAFPLPSEFQSILAKHGFAVSHWRCSALWAGYVGLLWGYGVASIAKHAYDGLSEMFRRRAAKQEPYAYFAGLSRNTLPQPCKDGRSHDIITWYANWDGADRSVAVLSHGVAGVATTSIRGKRVECSRHIIPPLDRPAALVGFLGWALNAIVLSAVDGLQGRWWHAALLAEFAKAAVVRVTNTEALAREYLFHFSDTIYRPLWTYEAVKKGSMVTCYFYSTSEEYKLPDGYERNSRFWPLMTWPRFLVWDSYQEDLVRRSIGGSAEIRIVGPIWFNASLGEMPEISGKAVAVFDIQPFRASSHFGFSTMNDYGFGKARVPIKFVEDIAAAVTLGGGVVVHKRKRQDGKRFHKAYRTALRKLSFQENFVSVEPEVSAIRVIEHCQAVISMPFTSTGILGEYLNKPSAYYDPTGLLHKDDTGAHGLPVLSSKEELNSWVLTVLTRAVKTEAQCSCSPAAQSLCDVPGST